MQPNKLTSVVKNNYTNELFIFDIRTLFDLVLYRFNIGLFIKMSCKYLSLSTLQDIFVRFLYLIIFV